MTLTEMFEQVLLEGGQFLLPSSDIELDVTKFKALVNRVLGIYSKYHPVDIMHDLSLGHTAYTFTDKIPVFISDVIPVMNPMMTPIYQAARQYPQNVGDLRQNFVWKYNKPTLYVPVAGAYNIQAVYPHEVTVVPESDPEAFEVLTIDYTDTSFLKLLTGYFLVALGRNRRAFTIQELPITADATDLVSDGTTMVTDGMTTLTDIDSKFYLAWG